MPRPFLKELDAVDAGTLLTELVGVASDAVIVADASKCVVLFNAGAEGIFGYRPGDVLGQPLNQLLPEPQRGPHTHHMDEFASSETAARPMAGQREIQGRRADGSLFEAEASIAHVALGGRVYFAVILRDVSDARRAKRALELSEARFRSLAETAPVGIFQTDVDGNCTFVNDRWSKMTGLSLAQAHGPGWMSALHPADLPAVQKAWVDAVGGRGRFAMHYRFLRPDGTETWVMGHAEARRDADGTVHGHLGTVTDVTESHAQAQALERAKQEAEAAVRAKNQFLAHMSHEIRTPLNAVIGMTTLLLDTPMSDDQQDCARTIRSSGESLLAIIDDILDFMKADAGKVELEQQAFDLRRCVEEALDQVTALATDKGLNLACLIEDGTPEWLVGDSVRVRQILVNLLSNAVKFTDRGEVFVSVDSEVLDDGAHRLHVAVKDSGIGIQADQLPRLFHSFTQVDASTTRKYGGSGLGLAICKRLAELMGGRVWVQSDPGAGSVFHASFVARPAAGIEASPFLGRNMAPLAGKRLLIVDAQLTNRRILSRLALRWGMVPSTLPSALEAVDRVRQGEAFDVALVDMSVPGIDGPGLAAMIHGSRPLHGVPVLMMSPMGQRRALPWGASAHVAGVLTRPIKAAALFDALMAVLGSGPALVSLPEPVYAPVRVLPHRPLRVLLAEDQAVNQRVALGLLQRLGCRVDVAANGVQAIEAVERHDYDVVLMDIQMPEMDGIEASRWIVQRRGLARGPSIIAMTANAMPGDREAYLACGMDDYVAKPIDPAELAAALERMSRREEAAEEVLDPSRLDHLRSLENVSQPNLLGEVIDLFTADSPGHLRALTEALAVADAPALRSAAHRFLSATLNIGARRMSALCAEIECSARAGLLDGVPLLLARLAEERERVQSALAGRRAAPAGRPPPAGLASWPDTAADGPLLPPRGGGVG